MHDAHAVPPPAARPSCSAHCALHAAICCLSRLLPPPPQGYDQTRGGLVTVMVLMCVGIVVALAGLAVVVGMEQRYARPLSYHLDVDRVH